MILSYLLEENRVLIIVSYKEFGSMHQITGSFQAIDGAKGLGHRNLTTKVKDELDNEELCHSKAIYYTNAPSETSFHKRLSRP